jgi:NTP pyrophosphatase (non-canonical NTP hydrolase)
MSLGLGGEAGEVAEIVLGLVDTGILDKVQAQKEMGDVLYYWARICAAFDLSAQRLLFNAWSRLGRAGHCAQTVDVLAGDFSSLGDATVFNQMRLGLALNVRAGCVQEIIKKRIRDGDMDTTKLGCALEEVIGAWCRLCLALGLVASVVIRSSYDKIEDRKARGVMRGNGNDR